MKTFSVRIYMLSQGGNGGLCEKEFSVEAPDAFAAREHSLSMLRPYEYDNRLWVECDGIRVAPPVNASTMQSV